MTSSVHSLIKQRREQLGIGQAELARRIGVASSEYWDVELYDDELIMALPLKNARLLAEILGFELGALFAPDSAARVQTISNKPRHIVLAQARNKLGVSTKTMADEIGFEEVFVERIESRREDLDNYPYYVLKIVADYLKLDPMDVLHAPCA
jgi:transcriptional regulator with XRE-family HTH domain